MIAEDLARLSDTIEALTTASTITVQKTLRHLCREFEEKYLKGTPDPEEELFEMATVSVLGVAYLMVKCCDKIYDDYLNASLEVGTSHGSYAPFARYKTLAINIRANYCPHCGQKINIKTKST